MQQAINEALGTVTGLEFVILTDGEYDSETGVPTIEGSGGKIYLVPLSSSEVSNIYTEWVYINTSFEKIGNTAVDLSNYVKNTDLVPLTNEQIDTIMSGS